MDEDPWYSSSRDAFVMSTALLRCHLALLYRCFQNEKETAVKLWQKSIFSIPKLLRSCERTRNEDDKYSYSQMMSFLMESFPLFVVHLHEVALLAGGTLAEELLEVFKHLRLGLRSAGADMSHHKKSESTIDILVARIYIRCGRQTQAHARLYKAMSWDRESICLTGSRCTRYRHMAVVLFLTGNIPEAEIALSLSRFTRSWQRDCVNTSCANSLGSNFGMTHFHSKHDVAYHCMSCEDVIFCEPCYQKFRNSGDSTLAVHVCNSKHDFLRTPRKNWLYKEGCQTLIPEEPAEKTSLDEADAASDAASDAATVGSVASRVRIVAGAFWRWKQGSAVMTFLDEGSAGRKVLLDDWAEDVVRAWKIKMGSGMVRILPMRDHDIPRPP
ncbi:hypothetical protein EJ06DRAFT_523862 [Trichodelitschia bisporula]|uniref:Uncharacterized protein n=1 Tax=Trichodelitschia bisporula TaxID=703511 RepID=A0A6G1HMU0_9PEZI|nr:hypothetical protein EJ06DRAFT_523862 [Trichodelitschia bisporula]